MTSPYRSGVGRFRPVSEEAAVDRAWSFVVVARGAYRDIRAAGVPRLSSAVRAVSATREVFRAWSSPLTLDEIRALGEHAVSARTPPRRA